MPTPRKYLTAEEKLAARRANDRRYRARNVERERASGRAYYAANKDRKAVAAKARRVRLREQGIPEATRLARLAYYRDYLLRNPAKSRAWAAAKNRKRRYNKINYRPPWVNNFFVEEIYDLARLREAATGVPWHVDHVVPIKSPLVCGLHCEQNLDVITASANARKRNLYWPDMPVTKGTP